jgi:hypothetical protein
VLFTVWVDIAVSMGGMMFEQKKDAGTGLAMSGLRQLLWLHADRH